MVRHPIDSLDDLPIYTKPWVGFNQRKEIKQKIDDLLARNIIRHSYSPWSSPVWLVPKKKDAAGTQKWRLVVDFRKLNEKTIKDRYPMPVISAVLDKLGRAKYFTALDLASGYHQIEMRAKDIPKTAFTTDSDHFEYLRMPFGLTNAPATFQRAMDNLLGDLIAHKCLFYMDDIIVYSASLQEHIRDLQLVFEKLSDAKISVTVRQVKIFKQGNRVLGTHRHSGRR